MFLIVLFFVMVGVVIFVGVIIKVIGWDEEIYVFFCELYCFLDNGGFMIEIVRFLMNCDCCRNLKEFFIERNIFVDDFVRKYVYIVVFVFIKDVI